jgi:hypothetical protein
VFSTHRLHLDFRWRHLRQALEIRFMGFDVDGPLSAGSGGYCPTSVEKSDPGIMLSSGSRIWGIEALLVRQTRKLGKTLGILRGSFRDSRLNALPRVRVQLPLVAGPSLKAWLDPYQLPN